MDPSSQYGGYLAILSLAFKVVVPFVTMLEGFLFLLGGCLIFRRAAKESRKLKAGVLGRVQFLKKTTRHRTNWLGVPGRERSEDGRGGPGGSIRFGACLDVVHAPQVPFVGKNQGVPGRCRFGVILNTREIAFGVWVKTKPPECGPQVLVLVSIHTVPFWATILTRTHFSVETEGGPSRLGDSAWFHCKGTTLSKPTEKELAGDLLQR